MDSTITVSELERGLETVASPNKKQHTNSDTWLIVGLGNPGDKYANTRHNVGRMVIGELLDRQVPAASLNTHKKTNTDIAEVTITGRKVVLAQPRTYMNVFSHRVALFVVLFY